ncbi:MAG: hypothetical protein IPM59_12280 [Chloracidobacterium sp.]|nr:hypothetical protein [Chloracidobacterium sp.]
MPTESRTRVEFYLPVRSDNAAYQSVLDWLAMDLAHSRGGSTTTTPFAGLFSSPEGSDLISDAIRILFCDFELDLDDPEHRTELLAYLETTKAYLMSKLEEEEIWVVFYSIARVTS